MQGANPAKFEKHEKVHESSTCGHVNQTKSETSDYNGRATEPEK